MAVSARCAVRGRPPLFAGITVKLLSKHAHAARLSMSNGPFEAILNRLRRTTLPQLVAVPDLPRRASRKQKRSLPNLGRPGDPLLSMDRSREALMLHLGLTTISV
jgi:hypothetical protein